jgi:hypothetical protein
MLLDKAQQLQVACSEYMQQSIMLTYYRAMPSDDE